MADVSDGAVPAGVLGGRLLELFGEERFAELAGELSDVVGRPHPPRPMYSDVVEWILFSILVVAEERMGRLAENETFVVGVHTSDGEPVETESLSAPLSTIVRCVEALFDADFDELSALLDDAEHMDRESRLEIILAALSWLDSTLA
ncbi:hypothetical protein [Rhodococcus sp. SGAir0479]|uniref:hypothetical protein n=1 Tax=Rhodococcus sp. SGAir0479 TaxID=2567884 RepID=UPI0010CD245E|nr:hypothetical protein [Rhodococcus sp. SGAir0479]QCQ91366.1 hypothetical protein E7742_09020 [Rhodococcus sp. SGAir0479]